MKVIIFGSTGAIGTALISILSKEQPSWSIYAVTRDRNKYSKTFAEYPNVQLVQGDPHDKDHVMKLSADKDLVYSCIGFTNYEAKYWARNWSPSLIIYSPDPRNSAVRNSSFATTCMRTDRGKGFPLTHPW